MSSTTWQKLKAFSVYKVSVVFLWSNMSYVLCTSCQLNQHLQDSLCQQLLQLDEVSILSPPASIGEGEEEEGDGDMERQVCIRVRQSDIIEMSVSHSFCFKCPVSLNHFYSRQKISA